MAGSYIPTKQADLILWAQNFSTLITANPPLYGLAVSDATAIAASVTTFSTALTLAADPSTSTTTTVAAKDSAKAALIALLRDYAQDVKGNIGVANSDKIALGIHINDTTKTPVAAPSVQPLIELVGFLPLQATLKSSDPSKGVSRAKPAGAIGQQLFVFIGPTPPVDPLDFRFAQFVTKTPYVVNFDPADAGKQAKFYSRFQTATGLVGPWSTPLIITIPA